MAGSNCMPVRSEKSVVLPLADRPNTPITIEGVSLSSPASIVFADCCLPDPVLSPAQAERGKYSRKCRVVKWTRDRESKRSRDQEIECGRVPGVPGF
jgi:hypothetical protein